MTSHWRDTTARCLIISVQQQTLLPLEKHKNPALVTILNVSHKDTGSYLHPNPRVLTTLMGHCSSWSNFCLSSTLGSLSLNR